MDGEKNREAEAVTVLESESESDLDSDSYSDSGSDSDSDSNADPGGEEELRGASGSSGAEWSGVEWGRRVTPLEGRRAVITAGGN